MIFFSQKTTNKIFMYLLSPFIVQNFKKVLRADPELWDVPFLGPKWPICPENFFWYKPLLLLSSTYWPFSLCKIEKKILQLIQSYEDAPFWGPKWSICPDQFFFFWKIINTILIYLLALHCGKFYKNSSSGSRVWGCTIFGPKMAHFSKWEYFFKNLLMSLVYLIHAYLHAQNQIY